MITIQERREHAWQAYLLIYINIISNSNGALENF